MIEQVKLTEDEISKIKEFHEGNENFPIPDFQSPLYVIQRPIYDENMKLIGSYFLHLTSEITLILDQDLSKLARAKIVKNLVPEINQDCKNFGIDDTHVFIQDDENFEDFLIKNAGFKRATGNALYRKVTNE